MPIWMQVDHTELHVEGQWLNIRNRGHATDASHHLALNILQRLALRLGHVEYHKEQANEADGAKHPKGTMCAHNI